MNGFRVGRLNLVSTSLTSCSDTIFKPDICSLRPSSQSTNGKHVIVYDVSHEIVAKRNTLGCGKAVLLHGKTSEAALAQIESFNRRQAQQMQTGQNGATSDPPKNIDPLRATASKVVEMLEERFSHDATFVLLDLACGTGNPAIKIASLYSKSTVLATGKELECCPHLQTQCL